MNSTHCAHHWMIETANGPLSRGSCSLCGEEREFSNSPDLGGWTIQSKAWFDRSDWTGADLGVKTEYAEVDGEQQWATCLFIQSIPDLLGTTNRSNEERLNGILATLPPQAKGLLNMHQTSHHQGYQMNFDHMGIRWGYAFLRTTSHVPEIELEELMVQAVEMYLMDEEERIIKTSNYEGKLYTQRRHEILGGFGGQRFDAELETTQGRDSATFLVNEQTGAGSGFSRN